MFIIWNATLNEVQYIRKYAKSNLGKRHGLLLKPGSSFLKDVEKYVVQIKQFTEGKKVFVCSTCKWPIFRIVKGQANRTITICYGNRHLVVQTLSSGSLSNAHVTNLESHPEERSKEIDAKLFVAI